MGLGMAIAMIAMVQPKFSRNHWTNHALWLVIAFLLGFGVYQSSLLSANQWMEMHGLTVTVLARILLRDAL